MTGVIKGMFTKRINVCIASGAVLGLICIAGAMIRSGFEKDSMYLFAFWYNRLLMGVVIGLAGRIRERSKAIGRGALLGLLVSFAFYSSTAFDDGIGFLAGIVYGVIIEYVSFNV